MRVIGYDPGLKGGAGVIERVGARLDVLELVSITTDAEEPDDVRYAFIFGKLQVLVRSWHPELFSYERQLGAQVGAYERGEFQADNSKVNVAVGVGLGCAFAYGLKVVSVTPAQAKIAVLGKGGSKADKRAVKAAVARLTDAKRFSRHGADGVSIAIAGERKWQEQRALAAGAKRA